MIFKEGAVPALLEAGTNTMAKILLIDDDRALIETMTRIVSFERGYALKSVSSPSEALGATVSFKPDVILLDIKMPGGDGRQIIKLLKGNPATGGIPVIFLTGMSGPGDKVLGLDLGADDYVTKPFDPMELMARVRSVLRRAPAAGRRSAEDKGVVNVSGLKMDRGGMTAAFKGKPIRLQPMEFGVLYLLSSSPGRIFSRSCLIENLSPSHVETSTRSVDAHIKNIRRKLGPGAKLM